MPQEEDIRAAVGTMFGRRPKKRAEPSVGAMPEYHPSHPYDPSQSPRRRVLETTPPKRVARRGRSKTR
jgi:hypothetical protein